MRGHPVSLCAALLLGLSLAAASAGGAAVAAEGCSGLVPRSSQLVPNSQAGASSLHSYDDHIEDVVSAPDVCAMNFVTNDNEGTITMALHIHDRSRFSAGDSYRVFFDTDSNAATGSLAAHGIPAGAEFELELVPTGPGNLRRWNGAASEPVVTQAPIFSEWIDGWGPVLVLNRRDLADAQAFRFVFVTANGADVDLAPDFDMWAYELSPLRLTAGPLKLGPASAGTRFVALMSVERSDFEIALDEGRIGCAARVAGKSLAGRGSFVAERVACSWRIPATARAKRLSGRVSVTYQGVTAARSFSVRVR
jgi:hypothetical protein